MKRISIYLAKEDYELIKLAAYESETSLSSYIRSHIIKIAYSNVGHKIDINKEIENNNLVLPFSDNH